MKLRKGALSYLRGVFIISFFLMFIVVFVFQYSNSPGIDFLLSLLVAHYICKSIFSLED
ncbi:hypothetical protein [Anaerocellum diazotrophicum]|uniref:Uncharacterized protein n=1 Tax=Caldicellulosiruptor diazotrophicus TaxID=2806205 RepID=A0ABN6E5B0_9FIRM|nr:hypothetical protein [Caldicellulosiruptor diazotrophicus]BCS80437.1 hypothetical protein CaldiYA01_03970 [Caldicellulosiruptor diazotrophicus]